MHRLSFFHDDGSIPDLADSEADFAKSTLATSSMTGAHTLSGDIHPLNTSFADVVECDNAKVLSSAEP